MGVNKHLLINRLVVENALASDFNPRVSQLVFHEGCDFVIDCMGLDKNECGVGALRQGHLQGKDLLCEA
eukprot:scaffold648754_cov43-Prasinocladus_malaysianus.AAC.1